MTARKKKSKDCPFYFYSWCEWAKVKCHYTDEKLPPRPDEAGPCPWALRFCEKNFCPSPKDAAEAMGRVPLVYGGAPKRGAVLIGNRICPNCERPVRPLRDKVGYENYKETGLCQDCQEKQEIVRLAQDPDELTEDDFQ